MSLESATQPRPSEEPEIHPAGGADFARELLGGAIPRAEPVGAADGHEREARPGFRVRDVLETLTVVALVVYGAVHFGDYAFYARLVSPDEVGLDYGRTLGKVAVGIALFAATLALLLMAGSLLRSWDRHNGARGLPRLLAFLLRR